MKQRKTHLGHQDPWNGPGNKHINRSSYKSDKDHQCPGVNHGEHRAGGPGGVTQAFAVVGKALNLDDNAPNNTLHKDLQYGNFPVEHLEILTTRESHFHVFQHTVTLANTPN